MSFFKNIAEGLKINQKSEDDDYFLDDDYDDDGDDAYGDEQPRGGIFAKSKSGYEQQPEQRTGGLFSRKITAVPSTSMQVTMKKPRNINDSKEICDELLDGKAVVINLEGINSETAQRITDFTYGAVYSLDGDIKAISKYILIASPNSVELSGDFIEGFDMNSGSGQGSSYGSQSQPYYSEQRSSRTGSGFSFNG